jgi:hypothetical protein
MSALGTRQDNEKNSYTLVVDGANNEVAQRVKTFGLGNLLEGFSFDFIDVQQTSATVETYVYKTGGSGGTTVATITVVYTSASKTDIDTVTRT